MHSNKRLHASKIEIILIYARKNLALTDFFLIDLNR
jgi:hypothetical protein